MSFLLTFDIPREKHALEKRINRELRKIDAEMLQFSLWKSEKLDELLRIALTIRNFGGSARILEEKFIF